MKKYVNRFGEISLQSVIWMPKNMKTCAKAVLAARGYTIAEFCREKIFEAIEAAEKQPPRSSPPPRDVPAPDARDEVVSAAFEIVLTEIQRVRNHPHRNRGAYMYPSPR